jgi:hypothetical protein
MLPIISVDGFAATGRIFFLGNLVGMARFSPAVVIFRPKLSSSVETSSSPACAPSMASTNRCSRLTRRSSTTPHSR